MVEWLFLAVPWGCLGFVIVVFPDHTHLLFFFINLCEVLQTVEESTNNNKKLFESSAQAMTHIQQCHAMCKCKRSYDGLQKIETVHLSAIPNI